MLNSLFYKKKIILILLNCRCYVNLFKVNLYIYIYIYIYIYHHHHVVLLAWISLTLFHRCSLSFNASVRSSGLHPVSSHSCLNVCSCSSCSFCPAICGVPRSTCLMSSSLLLQQLPACLVRLTWIVFLMGGRWPYSWCIVGVAARTCSILLAAFLCNCRLVSSPAVLLASM